MVNKHKLCRGVGSTQAVENSAYVLALLLRAPVAENILVVGIDARHKYFFVPAALQWEQAVVFKKHYGVARRLESRVAVFVAQAHVHRGFLVGIGILEQPEGELDA